MLISEFIATKKPSDALTAMLDGIEAAALGKLNGMQLDFSTFGKVQDGFCYGCAATATVQTITGIHYTSDNIDSVSSRYTAQTPDPAVEDHGMLFSDFEDAIDEARLGLFARLFRLFGCDTDYAWAAAVRSDFAFTPQNYPYYDLDRTYLFEMIAKCREHIKALAALGK